MTDAEDNVWLFETIFDVKYSKYLIARPTSVTSRDGYQRVFSYDPGGKILQISDQYGRKIEFEWVDLSISKAKTPDGNAVIYTYDQVGAAGRLIASKIVNGSSTLLDKTTYEYENPDYPDFVTGIRDRNDVVRWTATYDAAGRAVSSSGPSGVEETTVSYADSSTTGTRTVTNALGKVATYNFTRTSASYYDMKFVGVDGVASANCPSSARANTYASNHTISASTDEEGRVTGYTWDASGRPTQVKEAQGTANERVTDLTYAASTQTPATVVRPALTASYTYETSTDPDPYSGGPPSTTGHAYWRLRMLSNGFGSSGYPDIRIEEIEFRTSAGGADQATGGTAIESGHDGANDAANAFDNSTSTGWDAPRTQVFDSWVGYHFPSAVAINQVALSETSTPYKPKDFVVESSDDGVTWAVEWYVHDVPWLEGALAFSRVTSPPKTAAYSDWRIRVWRSNATDFYAYAGGRWATIAELEFRATSGGADQATGGSVTSFSDYSIAQSAPKAFDNNAATSWASDQPARQSWISYSFPQPVSVAQVMIQSSSYTEETPKDFAIEYFAFGRWHVAKDIRGETGWTSGQTRTYSVP